MTAAEDPAPLEEQGFEVLSGWEDDAEAIDPSAVDWEADRISYWVRQRPGPENALGLVKFMFPNLYSVYLHDTPARSRFEDPRRALSRGCVRVEHPNALAEVLLSTTDEWPAERIAQAMNARERKTVRLDTPSRYTSCTSPLGSTVRCHPLSRRYLRTGSGRPCLAWVRR